MKLNTLKDLETMSKFLKEKHATNICQISVITILGVSSDVQLGLFNF